MVLTPSSIAYLAIDCHIPTKLVGDDGQTLAMVSVTIDRLEYDPAGPGVAYLDGSFYVHNYDQRRACTYMGELRLEILEPKGDGTYDTFSPDAKDPVSGTLKPNDDNVYIGDVYDSFSVSNNIHVGSLIGIEEDNEYTMSATTVVRVTIGRTTETWTTDGPENNPADTIDNYVINFRHNPEGETGLCSTRNGTDFSNERYGYGGQSWKSLVKTDGPYSEVYWSVENYAGTIVASGHSVGDGVDKDDVFEHTFPLGDGDPNSTASNYKITAYVYRWDLSVYWESYKVYVTDAPKHD